MFSKTVKSWFGFGEEAVSEDEFEKNLMEGFSKFYNEKFNPLFEANADLSALASQYQDDLNKRTEALTKLTKSDSFSKLAEQITSADSKIDPELQTIIAAYFEIAILKWIVEDILPQRKNDNDSLKTIFNSKDSSSSILMNKLYERLGFESENVKEDIQSKPKTDLSIMSKAESKKIDLFTLTTGMYKQFVGGGDNQFFKNLSPKNATPNLNKIIENIKQLTTQSNSTVALIKSFNAAPPVTTAATSNSNSSSTQPTIPSITLGSDKQPSASLNEEVDSLNVSGNELPTSNSNSATDQAKIIPPIKDDKLKEIKDGSSITETTSTTTIPIQEIPKEPINSKQQERQYDYYQKEFPLTSKDTCTVEAKIDVTDLDKERVVAYNYSLSNKALTKNNRIKNIAEVLMRGFASGAFDHGITLGGTEKSVKDALKVLVRYQPDYPHPIQININGQQPFEFNLKNEEHWNNILNMEQPGDLSTSSDLIRKTLAELESEKEKWPEKDKNKFDASLINEYNDQDIFRKPSPPH